MFCDFWISKKDVESLKGERYYPLDGTFHLKIESINTYSVEASFVSESYEEARKVKAQLIHWILVGEDMPCQVIMPDATVAEGIAESACKQLKPNTIIQFERFGFVRIDETNNKLVAYFAHK